MRLIFTFIALFLLSSGIAQQTTQYSQWSYNQFALNPALAGIKRCLDIRTAVRFQWVGFEGAPMSGLITINAPLRQKKREYKEFFHGIGGKIEKDAFGPFDNFAASLSYALHFPLGLTENGNRISFGLTAGVQQFGFNHNKTTTIDPDPAIAQSANLTLFPLIGFGTWYFSDKFYAGFSMDQLAKNKWSDIGFVSRFRLHTKIQGGTIYTFENENSILPSILIRIPPAGPASMDLNFMFDFKDQLMIGLGYRNTDAIIGFFKIKLKQFTIGYSFDFITSALRSNTFNTHEFSFQYNGCYRDMQSQSACPLFE